MSNPSFIRIWGCWTKLLDNPLKGLFVVLPVNPILFEIPNNLFKANVNLTQHTQDMGTKLYLTVFKSRLEVVRVKIE